MKPLLMLDSGAFTAWSKKVEIDIDEYIRFCQKNSWIDYFINLDVIGARFTWDIVKEVSKKSFDNYLYICDKLGMEKVIPVFHLGSSPEYLEKYLDLGVDYLALGCIS